MAKAGKSRDQIRSVLRRQIEALGFKPPDPKTEHRLNTPTQLRKRLTEIRSFGYSDGLLRHLAHNPDQTRRIHPRQTP